MFIAFQFTCPSRSTTLFLCFIRNFLKVSIHVPLAEHDWWGLVQTADKKVSIHVPLAEHDRGQLPSQADFLVSIHVPLAEHDLPAMRGHLCAAGFNSRAPRGARPGFSGSAGRDKCFNSRAPRGARQLRRCGQVLGTSFNSRAPRGARRMAFLQRSARLPFQFTCPSRSTTAWVDGETISNCVSIHVPLAEHDPQTGVCNVLP